MPHSDTGQTRSRHETERTPGGAAAASHSPRGPRAKSPSGRSTGHLCTLNPQRLGILRASRGSVGKCSI
jgi:hypothetical protein